MRLALQINRSLQAAAVVSSRVQRFSRNVRRVGAMLILCSCVFLLFAIALLSSQSLGVGFYVLTTTLSTAYFLGQGTQAYFLMTSYQVHKPNPGSCLPPATRPTSYSLRLPPLAPPHSHSHVRSCVRSSASARPSATLESPLAMGSQTSWARPATCGSASSAMASQSTGAPPRTQIPCPLLAVVASTY